MTPWTLVRQGLRHHWRGHLAVALGVAVAGAVLVGSLVIGDSVRSSLEALVSERLGAVELAVLAPGGGVRAELAREVEEALGGEAVVAPVLRISAVLAAPSGEGRVVGVQLLGVTAQYWRALGVAVPEEPLRGLRPNRYLEEALGLEVGAEVVVRVDDGGATPLDAPMAVAPSGAKAGLQVIAKTAEALPGGFSLEVHGGATMTALVPLTWLSQLVTEATRPEAEVRANALLVRGVTQGALSDALGRVWRLADMGLSLAKVGDGFALRSARIVLPQAVVDAARGSAGGEVLTWFANTLRSGEREVPYSFVSAVSGPGSWSLEDDQIAVNTWLAEQLGVVPGDAVEIVYPTFGARRTRGEARASFRVAQILPMEGLAADPSLSIAFPGFAGARSCRDWEPGVHIDLDRIRPVDEAYWAEHQGTPKAFVSPAAAARMWANPYGPLTSLRATAEAAATWRAELPRAVSPSDLGVQVQPVARAAMEAASPTTDFGGLFLGLGSLLMFSAMLLVVLLLRLGVVQREAETAALTSVGLPSAQIRALRLWEGAITVCLGSALGVAFGVQVARWTLEALAGNWAGAIGGLSLVFSATGASIALGVAATLFVGLGALLWTGRAVEVRSKGSSARVHGAVCLVSLVGAAALLATLSGDHPAAAYFGAGALLLIAGLAGMGAALRVEGRGGGATVAGLAWLNLARRPGASVAATAILAAGTFVVVGVGVSRHDPAAMTSRASGTGGFALVGESTLPVSHPLDTGEGLAAYGLSEADLFGASVVPLRVRDGDDASCLNLAQAPRPTLYGVQPEALASREAFGTSVWAGLAPGSVGAGGGGRIVPAVGDAATLTWRLKLGVGDELEDVDEYGQPYRLRIVGVLPTSILQGGLLVDGRALAERFPTTSSDRLFLIDAPPERAPAVGAMLSDALGDTGFRVTPAVEVLGRYLRVENTYLAIFLALGGFGLLLGAPGVGVLLFRQVLTRRRELAVLQSMGWRRGHIRWLVALEHGAIVALGVGIGGLSAALAVVPALGSSVSRDPAQAAAVLITGVTAFGLFGVGVATRVALRGRLADALSEEP